MTTSDLNSLVTLFLSLLFASIPFLLLGIAVSSFLLVYLRDRQLAGYFPRNPFLGSVVGTIFGCLLPLADCAGIPVARRLLLKGLSPAISTSFLIAAMTINSLSMRLSLNAFLGQGQIVLLRLIFGATLALVIGGIFSFYKEKQLLLPTEGDVKLEPKSSLTLGGTFILTPEQEENSSEETNWLEPESLNKSSLFAENVLKESVELMPLLVLGCAIATTIQIVLPQNEIMALGQTPMTRLFALMSLATILSLGSTADSSFASNLDSLYTNGSLLAFMVFGSIASLKNIVLLLGVFRFKPVIYLLILSVQLTLLLSMFFNWHLTI